MSLIKSRHVIIVIMAVVSAFTALAAPPPDKGGGNGGGGNGGGNGGGGNGGGGGGGGGFVMDRAEAMRFLYRASWGPTEAAIEHIRTIGAQEWVAEQLTLNLSLLPQPPDSAISRALRPAQSAFFSNAVHSSDQLRQRMAFFLHQIWVVSGSGGDSIQRMVPYMRLLHDQAFGNYRDLMRAMTLNPAMGDFLDMVNNRSASSNGGRSPNENYARELLQLFTVGPVILNIDGSPKTDRNGHTAPTYTEDNVIDLARALTGWTYPATPGEAESNCQNPRYYAGAMTVRCAGRHDSEAKVLMNNFLIPAGLTAEQELEVALDHIFQHPNMGPFLATRMIHHFVTSHPSSSYVKRVAKSFNDNGFGVRGDLAAMLRATLMDREADSADVMHGRLREPVHYAAALLRAFNATVAWGDNRLDLRAREMGQDPYEPPDVFNYFHLAHGTFHGGEMSMADGPEFAIHTLTSALARADFVYRLSRDSLGTGTSMDLAELADLAGAGDREGLLNELSRRLIPSGTLDPEDIGLAMEAMNGTNSSSEILQYAIQLVTTPRFQVQP